MAGKKNIAFLCHPYHRGGVTRWMADAAIALDAKGYKVWFITVDPVKEFHSAKGRETMLQLLAKKANTVALVTVKVSYEFEFGTDEYRAYVYQGLILRVPAGTPIILSDSAPTWAAATMLQNIYPVVGVLHADEAHYYALAEQYHQQVDLFACVSGRVRNTVINRIPAIDTKKIYTIPCGIELPATTGDVNTKETLQLAYVGRISQYQKRTGDLGKIAVMLHAQHIPFHMNIIGDGGADRQELEAQVKKDGLQDKVSFLGWLPQQEVAAQLAKTDVLLLTSDFEGTPIAMMEALAAGCGMVGTRVSGIEDYEYHQQAKDCYRVYEVGALQEAVDQVKELMAIPRSQRMSAARKLAAMEFAMDVCLDSYIDGIAHIPDKQPGASTKTGMRSMDLIYSRFIALARYTKLRLTAK